MPCGWRYAVVSAVVCVIEVADGLGYVIVGVAEPGEFVAKTQTGAVGTRSGLLLPSAIVMNPVRFCPVRAAVERTGTRISTVPPVGIAHSLLALPRFGIHSRPGALPAPSDWGQFPGSEPPL